MQVTVKQRTKYRSAFYLLLIFITLINSEYSYSQNNLPPEKTILVTYTGPDSTDGIDSRNLYFVELLKQALEYSDKNYSATMGVRGASHARQMKLVEDGTIDVMWDAPNPGISNDLVPIEIPIDKGLIGWRIFFIKKKDQSLFTKSTTLDDLKKLRLGQVKSWHDTAILIENDLNVLPTPNYLSTFKMLMGKRFTYFPRSVSEIWREKKERKDLLNNIVIEKNLVLHYPIAYFYYLNKNNRVLANDIESGLEKMLADGSFDKLFNKYNGEQIALAELDKRKIITINNPFLNQEAYNKYKKIWFDPTLYTKQVEHNGQ